MSCAAMWESLAKGWSLRRVVKHHHPFTVASLSWQPCGMVCLLRSQAVILLKIIDHAHHRLKASLRAGSMLRKRCCGWGLAALSASLHGPYYGKGMLLQLIERQHPSSMSMSGTSCLAQDCTLSCPFPADLSIHGPRHGTSFVLIGHGWLEWT